MQIYNSLTRKKEEFVPNEPGKVSMYTCGPTVYHFAHIGNLRSYIMEDVLEKYLRSKEPTRENLSKAFRYLMSKGFDYDVAKRALTAYGELDEE